MIKYSENNIDSSIRKTDRRCILRKTSGKDMPMKQFVDIVNIKQGKISFDHDIQFIKMSRRF